MPYFACMLNELSAKVPNICHLAPAGPHHIEELYMAGGVPAIMKELTKRGLLDLSLITATGKTVGENLEGVVNKNPEVVRPLENPYSRPAASLCCGATLRRTAVLSSVRRLRRK